jgi:hypothetical protein
VCVCVTHSMVLEATSTVAVDVLHAFYPMFSTLRSAPVAVGFHFWIVIPTLNLRPSRSNHHCLSQHKFRSSVVCFVYILKLCTVCNVNREVSVRTARCSFLPAQPWWTHPLYLIFLTFRSATVSPVMAGFTLQMLFSDTVCTLGDQTAVAWTNRNLGFRVCALSTF